MVEELDLTDQDVSVIAAMIDSEFRSLVPDWTPRGAINNDGFDGDTITEISVSVPQGESSPTAHEASQPGPLVLERLPSGRKYWSDSPKASGGLSPPLKLGPSHLMSADSTASGETWSEITSQSPFSHKDISISHEASPLRHVEYDYDHEEDAKSKHEPASAPSDLRSNEFEPPPSEESPSPSGSEGGDIKSIVKKLDTVLDEQLKELNELKQKHRVAVSDLLKDLPQEAHQRIISMCNAKINGTN